MASLGLADADSCPRTASDARRRYLTTLARLAPADQQLIVALVELGFRYDQLAVVANCGSPRSARLAVIEALLRFAQETAGEASGIGRQVAEAICDGISIDWAHIRGGLRNEAERRAIDNLRVVFDLITDKTHEESWGPASAAHGQFLPRILTFTLWTLVAVSLGQVLLALAGYVVGLTAGPPEPILRYGQLVALSAFVAAGMLLIHGGRSDPRSRYLGVFFLIIAAAFSQPYLSWVTGPLAPVCRLNVDAFLPFTLWLFVRDFPRACRFSRSDALATAGVRVSAWIGATLVAANLPLVASHGLLAQMTPALARTSGRSAYWLLVIALMLPAIPCAHLRSLAAGANERKRLVAFTTALLVGVMPILLSIVADVPSWSHRLVAPYARVTTVIVFVSLVSIPFTTAYAVLVRRVLDVHVVVRQTYRRLLEQQSVLVLSAIPLVWLAWHIQRHRATSVGMLILDGTTRWLLVACAAGLTLLAGRRPLLASLDRRLFRDEAVSHALLAKGAGAIAFAPTIADLGRHAVSTIEQVCRPGTASLLIALNGSDLFIPIAGPARPLARDSAIVFVLARQQQALWVDAADRASLFQLLPEDDAYWALDSRASAVLPIFDPRSRLVGILAVGRGHDDLLLAGDDWQLVSALTTEVATVLNRLQPSSTSDPTRDMTTEGACDDEPAAECPRCRAVVSAQSGACPACRSHVLPAHVPLIVARKFRVDAQLGAGGMGVVYRATDLSLGRTVALKTLPKLSIEALVRMRREAQAMAAVTHPNLAAIFDFETWRGRPLLILEYLPGGTLAARLQRGVTQPIEQVLVMGIALASGLEQLHHAGILHRDVKPTNIGFAADGAAKLLDFGLARLMTGMSRPQTTAAGVETSEQSPWMDVSIVSRQLVGTPRYMAPDLDVGVALGPWVDLWSLAVVLFESVSGAHPFENCTRDEIAARVDAGRLPLLSHIRPDASRPLARFFEEALHARRSRRPQSAAEMRQRLVDLSAQMPSDHRPVTQGG